jgi:predicted anti-sigma-YlaC factor YlaD
MVTEKYARVVNPSASRIYLNMIERYLYSMPALVIIAVTVFMGMMSAVGQQVNQPQELQPFTSQMSGTEEV